MFLFLNIISVSRNLDFLNYLYWVFWKMAIIYGYGNQTALSSVDNCCYEYYQCVTDSDRLLALEHKANKI